jgi:C-terminal processing protease CtpA/Prc
MVRNVESWRRIWGMLSLTRGKARSDDPGVNVSPRARGPAPVGLLCGVLATATLAACAEDALYVPPPADCELDSQKEWVYDTMEYAYLFRTELAPKDTVDFEAFETPEVLLAALRVSPDRWSRVSDKEKSDALFMEGKTIGTGLLTKWTEDDTLRVAFIYPESPAEQAGIARGDTIVSVNGTPALDRVSLPWGENEPGVVESIEVLPLGAAADATPTAIDLTRDWFTIATVPQTAVIDAQGTKVGYLHFKSFVEPSIDALNEAFAEFQAQGVTRVVVDMRYNGGGLVKVARHLMHLLAGANNAGEVAYRVVYNDNLQEANATHDFQAIERSIALDRVVFITTGSTASASELVINAVRPWVDVTIVGTTTAGKPVGSNSFEFCEKLLYPISFKLVNADDEGEYFDGLTPDCEAADDLDHPLASPEEGALAVSLSAATTGGCGDAPLEGALPIVDGAPASPAITVGDDVPEGAVEQAVTLTR